ncbi:MAG TPA: hemolysin family protein, partial [Longimicrobiales bacterium]|nr:hemolysin family protein [Longimicrobiales bacterium]
LNTISHTVGAAMAGAIALEVFGDRWIAAFSAVLTLLILIFSEIIPKTLGATWWQKLAPITALVLRWMILLMKPILVPLAWFNRLITPRNQERSTVSRAELEVLAEIGRREGAIDQAEWRVMTNVMNLDEVLVGQVMTPRTQIVAIPATATLEEAQHVMLDTGRLRLPVYERTLDEVTGVVLARDLWKAQLDGGATLRDVMRAPTFVPASKPVEEQIQEMRQRRIKMAIVLDEFGGTAGLVTLEDLIEEIVGEIQDEHELEPQPFEGMPDGETHFDGATLVAEVNERLDLSLPEEDYDTAGGFVFGTLGRVPGVGDEVAVPEGVLRVVAMEGRRVARLAYVPGGTEASPLRAPPSDDEG